MDVDALHIGSAGIFPASLILLKCADWMGICLWIRIYTKVCSQKFCLYMENSWVFQVFGITARIPPRRLNKQNQKKHGCIAHVPGVVFFSRFSGFQKV